jgi:hypothetical protein
MTYAHYTYFDHLVKFKAFARFCCTRSIVYRKSDKSKIAQKCASKTFFDHFWIF